MRLQSAAARGVREAENRVPGRRQHAHRCAVHAAMQLRHDAALVQRDEPEPGSVCRREVGQALALPRRRHVRQVAQPRSERSEHLGDDAGQSRALQHARGAGHERQARSRREQPAQSDTARHADRPARRVDAVQAIARDLDHLAHVDARGTDALAMATHQARVDGFDVARLGIQAPLGDRAHQVDASPRALRFDAGQAVRRTVVEAQTAMDAVEAGRVVDDDAGLHAGHRGLDGGGGRHAHDVAPRVGARPG